MRLRYFFILSVFFWTHATAENISQVAIGQYTLADKLEWQLLILNSHNNGRTWFQAEKMVNLPSNLVEMNPMTVSCLNNFCLTAGKYQTTAKEQQPLLITSYDKGQHWNWYHFNENKNGVLQAASCTTKSCIVVGNGYAFFDTYPMIQVTRNEGGSWFSIEEIANVPFYAKNAFLNVISCSDQLCAAGGAYKDHGNEWPFLVVSHDQGESWQFVPSIVELPNYFQSKFVFNAMHCNGKRCLAGGWYRDKDSAELPLLMMTIDNGKTWTFSNLLSTDLKMDTGKINDIYCDATHCVAVGEYHEFTKEPHPLLLESKDSGSTWRTIPDALNISSGKINSLSCTEKYCVAVGISYVGIDHLPLILVKKNSHWSMAKIDAEIDAADSFDLLNVYCKDSVCSIVGEHYIFKGADSEFLPLLMVSENEGNAWHLIKNINGFEPKTSYSTLWKVTS